MKLTKEQINDIAQDLDCGLMCYINRKTGEKKAILDSDHFSEDDDNPYMDDMREVEDNQEDYLEIVGFDSRESYRIMTDFVERVDDHSLQERLSTALNNRKPFQNFKNEIDNAGEYREEWFKYKNKRLEQWIEQQIELDSDDFMETEW